MLNIKKSLAVMAIGSAMLLPMTSSATVTNFGDITNSTSATGNFSTIVIGGFVFDGGDTFNFSLNAADKSNISIDLTQLFGINIGNSYFSLKQGATEISQIALDPLILLKTESYSFNSLVNGNYSLSLIPSNILALNFGGTVSITAIPVPEPETNALMFLGLGIIGMIARRKFV
ncbi:FxDxF family PEP-CTERM protein [Methylophilus flavus]|uniref:FxDxF family PEP-CTERM protein n=1 Tax=Methylophilus flavus TaxID=640084 RepID=A0ABW3PBG2_9PROT